MFPSPLYPLLEIPIDWLWGIDNVYAKSTLNHLQRKYLRAVTVIAFQSYCEAASQSVSHSIAHPATINVCQVCGTNTRTHAPTHSDIDRHNQHGNGTHKRTILTPISSDNANILCGPPHLPLTIMATKR